MIGNERKLLHLSAVYLNIDQSNIHQAICLDSFYQEEIKHVLINRIQYFVISYLCRLVVH